MFIVCSERVFIHIKHPNIAQSTRLHISALTCEIWAITKIKYNFNLLFPLDCPIALSQTLCPYRIVIANLSLPEPFLLKPKHLNSIHSCMTSAVFPPPDCPIVLSHSRTPCQIVVQILSLAHTCTPTIKPPALRLQRQPRKLLPRACACRVIPINHYYQLSADRSRTTKKDAKSG